MKSVAMERERNIVTRFKNCSLLRNHEIIREDLWIQDGKIINPELLFFDAKRRPDLEVECRGAILSPGFIDLQINGGFGVDFSHNEVDVEEGVKRVATGLLQFGVTAFCPTIISSTPEKYHKILPRLKRRIGSKENGAEVLGVHLEGPFISAAKRGAHFEEFIRPLDKGWQSVMDVYGCLENVSIVTLAPELHQASGVISRLITMGITVSLGHSSATLVEGEVGVQNGASFITHLFNAMPPFHHRDPGLVGLLTSIQIPSDHILFYGVIADGIHTHPAALRIAYRTHYPGLVLVTDAISAMGLGDGTHILGEQRIQIDGRRATIKGTTTLAGSVATMDQCIQHLRKAARCSTVEALEAATLHPAQVLGDDKRKGSLDYGADADFVLLDEDLNVQGTFIRGIQVYANPMLPPFEPLPCD
ncbi:unnamed protein product [Darwinula stevensoni]|uniref:N-acetylglucosamine-6-phosphate deacetylase n=1 Tax=Darwinula stevensoni TaxID=69355 RepID=A0A7R9A1P7_9CRUS|nr:unnamed protein product [Darwinula stevensoni]CAG0883994.1 unnamed protein product [Darwinula stevensoni]